MKLTARSAVQFSTFQLNLPDAIGVAVGDLSRHQRSFDMHYDGIGIDDEVQIFKCVIGQNGKLIHIGDYVKLSCDHYEVRM